MEPRTREADLLIGTFADNCLSEFEANELRRFEQLLEQGDAAVVEWIAQRRSCEWVAQPPTEISALLKDEAR